MVKSKKKFIDKKNASTFHLLHRSQRDENNEDGGGMVLWPSPHNVKRTNERVLGTSTMDGIKHQLGELGLVDDFDYEGHLKPITGSGVVLDATGKVISNTNNTRASVSLVQENDVNEVSRQLESIALTPDCMDEDVAQALFGDFDDGHYEEILDDFCLTAAQEPEEEEEEEFDYDAHIRGLLEKARRKTQGGDHDGVPVEQHVVGKSHHDYFSSVTPLHERDDDESDGDYNHDDLLEGDLPGIVSSLDPQEEKALCEKFQQTLAEYDSDDVGGLDQACDEIRGDRPLEGDVLLEMAMDEYLEEKRDEIFMEGTRHLAEKRRTGGSSFAALVGKQLVHASDLGNDQVLDVHEETPLDEALEEAKELLANPVEEPPAEEVLIDGKSYFSERTRNPWDCESILSTYSNLDNNPVTIESKRRRSKKKSKQIAPEEALPEDEPVQIQLSSKTGLPLGVLSSRYDEQDEDEDDTMMSRNRGEARKKNETKEEKKARKLAVKKEREIARIQKKMMKDAFKDEFAKRSEVTGDDVGGKSVFRYS